MQYLDMCFKEQIPPLCRRSQKAILGYLQPSQKRVNSPISTVG